ncbi:MAG: RIP metalloprotease RseP [Sphaerochaetaceae bacterium]|nr:RIP metalloprotease RseP [Sphaerochaetaceae bacterium]
MSSIFSIIIGMVAISIMILVHELGHSLTGRIFGVRTEAISFGFGPAIAKWGKKIEYRIGVFPFGGYTKLKGSKDVESSLARSLDRIAASDSDSLYAKSSLQRLLIYLGGPLFNIFFSLICFFFLMLIGTSQNVYGNKIALACDYPRLFSEACLSPREAGLLTGDIIVRVNGVDTASFEDISAALKKGDTALVETSSKKQYVLESQNGLFGLSPFIEPVVATVKLRSPERNAGLKAKDRIVSINGKRIGNMLDILMIEATEIEMIVERDSSQVKLSYESDGKWNFTLLTDKAFVKGLGLVQSIKASFSETARELKATVDGFIGFFAGDKDKSDSITGSISASSSIGDLTSEGFNVDFVTGLRTLIYAFAGVSISLAVANLLPFPSLDGGFILLYLFEIIRGRSVSPRTLAVFESMGFVFIAIMLIALSMAKYLMI